MFCFVAISKDDTNEEVVIFVTHGELTAIYILQESPSCTLGTEKTKTVVKITKLFLQC